MNFPDHYFEDFRAPIVEENQSNCDHDNRLIDGYYTCILCGQVGDPKFEHTPNFVSKNKYHCYKRFYYFREKLNLLAGVKQCANPQYNTIVDSLRNENFNSVRELRKVMKAKGFAKYYKYIYNIWYDIKRIKLFDLSYDDIYLLTKKFINFERAFKAAYSRKKSLSYNATIGWLLRSNNYPCYDNILLPKFKQHW